MEQSVITPSASTTNAVTAQTSRILGGTALTGAGVDVCASGTGPWWHRGLGMLLAECGR